MSQPSDGFMRVSFVEEIHGYVKVKHLATIVEDHRIFRFGPEVEFLGL